MVCNMRREKYLRFFFFFFPRSVRPPLKVGEVPTVNSLLGTMGGLIKEFVEWNGTVVVFEHY